MSADMHRGQRASLGNQTDHAIKAGYKRAADFFATQHKFFLLPGRHPYKFNMKLKSTLLASILATNLAMPAFAGSTSATQSLSQFAVADTQMMFAEDDKPMQLASLSTQEMKQTEGAFWIPFIILLRPCEVLSGIANPTVLEVARYALRILLQHRHMLVRGLA